MAATDPDFGVALKRLREERNLTQQQLATVSNLSIGTIRSLEQGVNDATWPTLKALCDALGVECSAFRVINAGESKDNKKRKT